MIVCNGHASSCFFPLVEGGLRVEKARSRHSRDDGYDAGSRSQFRKGTAWLNERAPLASLPRRRESSLTQRLETSARPIQPAGTDCLSPRCDFPVYTQAACRTQEASEQTSESRPSPPARMRVKISPDTKKTSRILQTPVIPSNFIADQSFNTGVSRGVQNSVNDYSAVVIASRGAHVLSGNLP
ncbi:hypothetical protein SAMN06295987_101151 [Novosphingobium mathurense]|uniref:Uncharacterized protein n=1 Tax=Novosphingobium mathurense TaxID=428990 RepID=A0A1U6GRS9_9SPHN|nr:hypothetical protein SAMN06295987_101151 [Novosphingobium mathurense]